MESQFGRMSIEGGGLILEDQERKLARLAAQSSRRSNKGAPETQTGVGARVC